MRRLIRVAILISLLGGSRFGRAEPLFRDAFDRLHLNLVAQSGQECGPVSLFNSLYLSSADLVQPIAQLKGSSLRERYKSFLNTYGVRRGRWSPVEGIALDNLVAMANDFAPSERGQFAGVQASPDIPAMVDEMVRSAEAGFLPVLFIGHREANGKYMNGHALLFLGVESDGVLLAYDSRTFQLLNVILGGSNGGFLQATVSSPSGVENPSIPLTTLESFVTFQNWR